MKVHAYHDFVQDATSCVRHFVEFINTTNTTVTENQCPATRKALEKAYQEVW